MKRRFLGTVAGVVMALSLVACGDTNNQPISTEQTTTIAPTTTEAPTTTTQAPTTTKEPETILSRDRDTYTSEITYDMLARNPEDYKEKPTKIKCKVVQIVSENEDNGKGVLFNGYRCNVLDDNNKTTGKYILVMHQITRTEELPGRILENDIVTFYGCGQGLYTYKTVMGDNNTIPLFASVILDLE